MFRILNGKRIIDTVILAAFLLFFFFCIYRAHQELDDDLF